MAHGTWHMACQTYVLNLFQFHRSLNQTQFLFSSPRLFRAAKLAALSAGLSPRSRWLSFLSKFSGLPSLLRLFRLPKSALFFVLLLLLSYSQGSVALTAHTSRVIEGSAPYLTFDGGRTKATTTDDLLTITLSDGTRVTPSTNTSSAQNPIRLPNVRDTLGDIGMLVPSSTNSVSLNDLVNRYHYWGDDDGDGQGANSVTATGSLSVLFYDKDSNTVSRSDTLDFCKAPYRVVLVSGSGSIETQYGVPNISNFNGQRVTYYISPYNNVGVCFVRPSLYYGGTGDLVSVASRDEPHFAGPASVWNPKKGFLVQSTNPLSYGRNFPTTGADGLYFDLLLGGIEARQVTWSSVSHGGITARAYPANPQNNWIHERTSVTRIELHGPHAGVSLRESSNPSPLTPLPSLPQTFELEGRDSSGRVVVKYGFVLKQWFVNRGNKLDTPSNHLSWCRSLGYRLSRVRDLTNAGCYRIHPTYSCVGAVGAYPRSGNGYYDRQIGAGLFSEWGDVRGYSTAGFGGMNHWTSDVGSNGPFSVYSHTGSILSKGSPWGDYAVCTTP
ncbi:hypothetical protein [Gilliamella sp. ESL0254]|uniref:hypothetical protein n=1 Tax=Gilliamella sp. ESL0254 TaxID=2705035 RepID=UPI00158099FF|nr:hypothetical protein [Gilliamella sp. ESL0254]NUF27568.1 hypothetical protein [Gilliamella sp. ESL0254]